ncbi:FAD-binding oxidoreductase [Sulfitobacter sp. F26204]|uniref:NAD(P)/FAD-dependent oxidoreductase n=1 Tax=Sulfitobacter sp. F26204 TaxID=2996014 RepID=UPI00225E694F|nr:FAD-binding oxidoreductase [Sulfitobacter sp. F26204]MCX7560962.1 FAD-binding oxidoreductase [Sulfitobacter sp. F26204]
MSDIIVIGAGIAGLSAAARLSPEAKVIVLEQEASTGYHASGRSAALFEENYGLPSVVALNKASADFHKHANGGYLSPRGSLLLAGTQERTAFFQDVVSLGLTQISIDHACTLVPVLRGEHIGFAAYDPAAQDIDTDRMMQDFTRDIRSNGSQIIVKAPVTAIERSASGWAITTGATTYRCRLLINAAGAWADDIARMAGIAPIGITPFRRSMARIPAPAQHDVSKWPVIFGVGEDWYAKPDAGALLVSPAEEDPVTAQDAWADDMVLAEGLARYEAFVTVPVTRLLTSWAGLRSFAPDRALVLGPDPEDANFFWCAGQGGYGFQTAPAASQFLADLVMKRSPVLAAELVAEITPERLRP